MKEKYRNIPEVLKREIRFRFACGMVFGVLFLIIQLHYKEVSFSFPCLLLGFMTLISGCRLLCCCVKGDYLCIRGICGQLETAGIRKRVKRICVDTESKRVKISVHRKIGNLARGNQVTLYLSKKTPVYEWDGNCMVCGYYALEAQSEEAI